MKKEYTIGQVAKKLNTTTRAIRFYEQKKLVEPSRITERGYRIYNQYVIDSLQVIIYLRSLGFSVKKVQQLLNEENSSKSLELLISQEIDENREKIKKLKNKQQDLKDLQLILHRRKLDKENISEVSVIMKNNQTLTQLRKTMIYYGLGILAIEIIGIVGIASLLIHKQILVGEILAGILVFILIILSIFLSKKYYQSVAYVCPICGDKFISSFKIFCFTPHTPHFRKLCCPRCHEKSYCLEVIR